MIKIHVYQNSTIYTVIKCYNNDVCKPINNLESAVYKEIVFYESPVINKTIRYKGGFTHTVVKKQLLLLNLVV